MNSEELKNLPDEQIEYLLKTEWRNNILNFAKLGGKEEIVQRMLDNLDDKSQQTPAQRLLLSKIKQHIRQGTGLSKLIFM
jgi:hypothetical protein